MTESKIDENDEDLEKSMTLKIEQITDPVHIIGNEEVLEAFLTLVKGNYNLVNWSSL